MQGGRALVAAAAALLLLAAPCAGFLAGLSPTDYASGDPLDVLALNLFSHRVSVPYDYFSLPFCPADAESIARAQEAQSLTLGQVLLGQRARLTGLPMSMLQDVPCAVSCTASFSAAHAALLGDRVVDGYRARLAVDDMPVVVRRYAGIDNGSRSTGFMLGYPLGSTHLVRNRSVELPTNGMMDGGRLLKRFARSSVDVSKLGLSGATLDVSLNNHLDFTVMYHVPDDLEFVAGSKISLSDGKSFRVVGFEVTPRSVRYPLSDPPPGVSEEEQCASAVGTAFVQKPMVVGHMKIGSSDSVETDSTNVKFTYSVRFVESKVKWVTRFDTLIKVYHGQRKIQVFAILNSLLLAVFLTSMFALVLLRTLRRDCVRYGFSAAARNDIMDDFHDDFENDSGWRMLRGDVFRAPRSGGLLCVLCGSGIQLTLVMFVTLLCATLGVISPGRRGQLVSSLIVVYALSSSVAGYVSASMHRAIGGSRWKLVTFGVALVLPGIAFGTFLGINIFLWAMGSIGAAPFSTLFLLLFLWLGVSVPLAFSGTYFGYIRKVHDYPVRTNQIPRQIPPQPSYLSSFWGTLAAGAIPFGIVAIELRLVLKSIMDHEIYHMFTFLFAVSVLLAVTSAEVSVVLSYMRLSNEDWAWWWPAFWSSGISGLYVLAFSVYLLISGQGSEAGHVVSNFLFLAYSSLFSLCFVLITGSIGCLSSLTFVRRIFSVSNDD